MVPNYLSWFLLAILKSLILAQETNGQFLYSPFSFFKIVTSLFTFPTIMSRNNFPAYIFYSSSIIIVSCLLMLYLQYIKSKISYVFTKRLGTPFVYISWESKPKRSRIFLPYIYLLQKKAKLLSWLRARISAAPPANITLVTLSEN